MKNVIIFCRQEGAAGISYIGEIDTRDSAKMLAADVNAVAEAAKARGLEAYVCCPHAAVWNKGSTYYLEYLSADVKPIGLGQADGLLPDCVGIALVGMVAKAGTENAFSCGSFNHLGWHDCFLNGKPFGEIGMYKTYFHFKRVPVAFVSGDEAACKEAEEELCGALTVATKRANYRGVADCYDEETTREKLFAVAKSAFEKAEKGEVPCEAVQFPIHLRTEYNRTDFCDDAYGRSNYKLRRTGARTLERTLDKITKFYDLLFIF